MCMNKKQEFQIYVKFNYCQELKKKTFVPRQSTLRPVKARIPEKEND